MYSEKMLLHQIEGREVDRTGWGCRGATLELPAKGFPGARPQGIW